MEYGTHTTLKNQVYASLYTDIITGVYPPDAILTEKALIEKYRTSRAPVREALTQLIGKHILTSLPRQGYRIERPNRRKLLEIVKFRSALETSFLENFHIYLQPKDLAELRAICDAYTACSDRDFMAHWHYNCKFHLTLFSKYGNEYAYKLMEDSLHIQTIFFVQKKHVATMDLHLAVLDYIERGEIATAATLLKADIEHILLPTAPPPPVK